jgi:hypothetical protein
LTEEEISGNVDSFSVTSSLITNNTLSEQNIKIFQSDQFFAIIQTPSLLVFRYPYQPADQL